MEHSSIARRPDLLPKSPPWTPEKTPTEYYGQHEQDRWVIERVFPGMKGGFFVEIGAADGVLLSNSYILERDFGWTGILIEPTDKYEKLKENRQATCVNKCVGAADGPAFMFELPGPYYMDVDPTNKLRSMTLNVDSYSEALNLSTSLIPPIIKSKLDRIDFEVVPVEQFTLEGILKDNSAPAIMQFLSLDVEGYEFEVLREFPFDKYIFQCMVIERPQLELRELLDESGYSAVGINKIGDIFYIHSSILDSYLLDQ